MPRPLVFCDALTAVINWSPMMTGDVGRKHGGQRAHMLDHGERVGGEAIDQDDQPEQREQREEAVEGDAGGDQPDIVVPDRACRFAQTMSFHARARHLPPASSPDVPCGSTIRLDNLSFIDACSATNWHIGAETSPLAKRAKQADGGGFEDGARAPSESDSRARNRHEGRVAWPDNHPKAPE